MGILGATAHQEIHSNYRKIGKNYSVVLTDVLYKGEKCQRPPQTFNPVSTQTWNHGILLVKVLLTIIVRAGSSHAQRLVQRVSEVFQEKKQLATTTKYQPTNQANKQTD
jgi:hypothetical protein